MTVVQEFTDVSGHRAVRDLVDAFRADEQAARGTELTRQILPHVGDCDGLSIMVETSPEERVDRMLTARPAARGAGLDLLTWATTTGGRRA